MRPRSASRAAARRRQYRPHYEETGPAYAVQEAIRELRHRLPPSPIRTAQMKELEELDLIQSPKLRRMVQDGAVSARRALALERAVQSEIRAERSEAKWKLARKTALRLGQVMLVAAILYAAYGGT